MRVEQTTRVPARLWIEEEVAAYDDAPAAVEFERTEPNEIALNTFIDGRGSLVSYYFDRESAIALAALLLTVVSLDA